MHTSQSTCHAVHYIAACTVPAVALPPVAIKVTEALKVRLVPVVITSSAASPLVTVYVG